jgi:hypothetical protein
VRIAGSALAAIGRCDDIFPRDLSNGPAVTAALPPETLRTYSEKDVMYVALAGVTHGPVITASQQHVYALFGKHTK